MKINKDISNNLNLAFNESKLMGCKILQNEKEVTTVFDQFALLEDGRIPKDTRVKVVFENVSRIATLLKLGEWNDNKASIKTLSVESLSHEVSQLQGEEMYGWEFINIAKSDKDFHKWEKNASLDLVFHTPQPETNTIDIFSEHLGENPKTLDLRIWFEKFRVETMLGEEIDEKEFIQRGQRAWNKVFNGTHEYTDKTNSKMKRLNKPNIITELKNIFKK